MSTSERSSDSHHTSRPLIQRSAADQAAALAAGEVSAVELTQAHLDRVAVVDGAVHAFLHVDTDEVEARWFELPRGSRQGRCFLLADRTP